MRTGVHIVLFSLMTVLSHTTFGQFSAEISKERYISICKSISELEEVKKARLIDDYDGEETLFFLANTKDVNLPITVQMGTYQIKIWHLQDLFVHGVLHWIEVVEVSQIENGFFVEIRSRNSDESRSDKPIIGGTLTFEIVEEKLQLKSEKVEFLE